MPMISEWETYTDETGHSVSRVTNVEHAIARIYNAPSVMNLSEAEIITMSKELEEEFASNDPDMDELV